MYENALKHFILDLKQEIAAQRFLLAGRRLVALLRKANFNPAQLRVPAGSPDGGQWTDTGSGTGSSGEATVIRVGARGRGSVTVRFGRGTLDATPAQAARFAIADMSARQSARQVREIDPTWRPRPSLTDPNSVEGAIRRAEGEAREAQSRLAELARARFGDNQGPLLDPIGPRPGIGTPSIEPFQAIRAYRTITGMPDIGNRSASRSSDGTVAFTLADDTPVFGVNSNSPAYTESDQAAAEAMRHRLVRLYPDVMETEYLGRHPNNALFHAEANALFRAAGAHGGSLYGRTLTIRVDRPMCDSCATVLPKLGLEVGNPNVTFIDGQGDLWIMRDGIWVRRGRK